LAKKNKLCWSKNKKKSTQYKSKLMKKFTKILENQDNERFYEISVELKLLIKAENEGEAGYLSDSILGSIEEQSDYTILNIEEKDNNTELES
jgi:hypothetical protein